MSARIKIPAIGSIPAFHLCIANKAQVDAFIERVDSYFKLSAQAWIDANNNPNADQDALSRRELQMAAYGELLLAPLGIKCDYPGLYPCFQVKGRTEYSTRNAVLAALAQ